MRCAACGSSLPDGARFCPGCGARTEAADPSRVPETRHERRLLTVLFADLAGFTAASDGADPEDVRARVRPFHALVRREAARTGGTVARVMGDGVMVVWGYPVAHEDDALRAVRAALAIRDGVRDLPGDLHARTGINTGDAVVAFGAADERADDAMGDAVNVAARLGAAAPLDGIVVGEATARLVDEALHADALEPLALKGKAEPVPAYLVRGLVADARRPPAGPFVGREAELAALRAAFERARNGRACVRVLVTGEPGIGKSRLAWELRRTLADAAVGVAGARWHTGRCRPGTGAPGWAMGEIVKAWAGISDEDSPATAAVKLDAALPPDVPDRAWLADRVGRLAGVEGLGSPGPDELAAAWARFLGLLAADGPAVVEIEDVHWADPELGAFLAGPALAGVGAPLLVLATGRPEAPALHPVLANPAIESMALAGLSAADAGRLVADLAAELGPGDRAAVARRGGGNPLFTAELARLVGQRGGTPAGAALPDTVQAVIAARLDLLAPDARAVLLDASVMGEAFWRGALAAVPGSARTGAGLDGALAALVGAELVRVRRESSLPGEVEYAFRHALVRDVAYATLTRADRAVRHAAAARWLADAAGPDRADLATAVADHDLAALELATAAGVTGLDVDAVRAHAYDHLLAAAAHAARMDAAAAVARLQAALTVAPTPTERLGVYRRLAQAQLESGAHRDVLATVEEALPLARRLGDVSAEGALLVIRARTAWHVGEGGRDHGDATRAVRLLESVPPSSVLVSAYAAASTDEAFGGQLDADAALAWIAKAVRLADELREPPPAIALRNRGMILATVDEAAGLTDLARSIEVSRAAGDSAEVTNSLSILGVTLLALGRLEDARQALEEAVVLARSRGMPGHEAQALIHLAYVTYSSGDLRALKTILGDGHRAARACQGYRNELGITAFEVSALERFGDPGPMRVAGEACLGLPVSAADRYLLAPGRILAVAAAGDVERVRAEFEHLLVQRESTAVDFDIEGALDLLPVARVAITLRAPDLVERMLPAGSWGVVTGLAVEATLRGLLAAAYARTEDAERHLRDAIAAWDGLGFRPEAAHAREALADVLLGQGRTGEARRLLEAATAAWETMGAPLRADAGARRLAGFTAA